MLTNCWSQLGIGVCGVAAFIVQNSWWSSGTCYHLKSPPGYISCKCSPRGANVTNGPRCQKHMSLHCRVIFLPWKQKPQGIAAHAPIQMPSLRLIVTLILSSGIGVNWFNFCLYHHGPSYIYMIWQKALIYSGSDGNPASNLICLILNHIWKVISGIW